MTMLPQFSGNTCHWNHWRSNWPTPKKLIHAWLYSHCPLAHPRGRPSLHKVVSLICTPTTTYPFVISKRTGMTVNQVANEVLYTGLIEMQELDAQG